MTENEAIIRFDFIRCALLGGTKPHIMPNEENIGLVDAAIQALEEVQQYRQIGKISTCKNAVEICKAMIERGIDPDNIAEYIKFEDNLMQRGYDLKRLLEMMEKYKQYRQIGTVEECREAVEKQTAYDPDKVVKKLEERTAFLKDCVKYGNETAEQQSKSYDTMMMYEVKDLVDDLLEIVKAGGTDGN